MGASGDGCLSLGAGTMHGDDAHGASTHRGTGDRVAVGGLCGKQPLGRNEKATAQLGAEETGSSRAGSGGESEGSVNQTELTPGRGDYRVPGKLLAKTLGTKQPSRARGNE